MEKVKPEMTLDLLAESQTKNSLTSIISNIYMKYKSVLFNDQTHLQSATVSSQYQILMKGACE